MNLAVCNANTSHHTTHDRIGNKKLQSHKILKMDMPILTCICFTFN